MIMNIGFFSMIPLTSHFLTHYEEYGFLYLLGTLFMALVLLVGILELFATVHLLKPAEQTQTD